MLKALDYFGDRALIKKAPRYATVRARTALETVCITQARFEKTFGKPLVELLPDDSRDYSY